MDEFSAASFFHSRMSTTKKRRRSLSSRDAGTTFTLKEPVGQRCRYHIHAEGEMCTKRERTVKIEVKTEKPGIGNKLQNQPAFPKPPEFPTTEHGIGMHAEEGTMVGGKEAEHRKW